MAPHLHRHSDFEHNDNPYQRLRPSQRLREILRQDNGVALIEFMLILPIFMMIFLAMAYFTDIIIVRNKVSSAADGVASLSVMYSNIKNDDMAAIMKAGEALLAPMDTNASILLVSVGPNEDKSGHKVLWSEGHNISAPAIGSPYTFPSSAGVSLSSEMDKSIHVVTVSTQNGSFIGEIINNTPLSSFDVPASISYQETSYALPLGVGERRWITRSP